MYKNTLIRKCLVFGIIILFVGSNFLPSISGNIKKMNDVNSYPEYLGHNSIIDNSILDLSFIYNITENLSNIIFTEYNESAGEIAKGRFFGTKGEWRAAEILYENMSDMGLYTQKVQIQNLPNVIKCSKLTHKLEVLDFGLKINNIEIEDCYIAPRWKGPEDNPELLDYNFSYKGLKVKQKPNLLLPIHDDGDEDYVFIKEESFRNPNASQPPSLKKFLSRFLHPYRLIVMKANFIRKKIESMAWKYYPHCKGIIIYDFNDNTHNMVRQNNKVPIIYINGTIGRKIDQDRKNATVDFYINQSYNDSVISYNVIGQLNATNPENDTVIIDCLYDSWWCQGTADSAIGMATVLGVAKYFTDNDIEPKYNLKFIGFCGEEYNAAGALYYEATHKDEKIKYIIDLNQIGFRQIYPKLTLNLFVNKLGFMNEIWKVAKKTDYVKRTNGLYDIKPIWVPLGAPSEDRIFVLKRPLCKTVCFLKCFPWLYHHRDGLNHTEGDVLDYFDKDDVAATGEIVLNIVKHLTT